MVAGAKTTLKPGLHSTLFQLIMVLIQLYNSGMPERSNGSVPGPVICLELFGIWIVSKREGALDFLQF